MMQGMITSEANLIDEAKLKTEHAQAAEKALRDLPKTGFTAASDDL